MQKKRHKIRILYEHSTEPDDYDIHTAQRTVLFRKSSHTANSVTFNRRNRINKLNSLRMFYDNFSRYEISPFYGKVNK